MVSYGLGLMSSLVRVPDTCVSVQYVLIPKNHELKESHLCYKFNGEKVKMTILDGGTSSQSL